MGVKKSKTYVVTDHAVLRYIDRVLGIDVEAIRKGLLTPKVCAAIDAGATSIRDEFGVEFRIKERTVTTIIEVHRSPVLVRDIPFKDEFTEDIL